MISPLGQYLKYKNGFHQFAQRQHDKGLREYQDLLGDYGYRNFIDPRTNKRFKTIYSFATFENIDREIVPIIYFDGYGLRRH